jgi:hypothetical protein
MGSPLCGEYKNGGFMNRQFFKGRYQKILRQQGLD